MQETTFVLTPSPNLSPKGERNMRGMITSGPGGPRSYDAFLFSTAKRSLGFFSRAAGP